MMNHGKFIQRNTLKKGYAQNFQSIGIAVTKDTRLCIINDVPLSYIKSLYEEGPKSKTDDQTNQNGVNIEVPKLETNSANPQPCLII